MIGATVSYRRAAAVVELQDAQGWKSLSDTPRYRAQIERVEIQALDVYTLIVDKIDLSDDISTSDSAIFKMDKALSDDAQAVESIAFEMSKPFSDNVSVNESIIFSMEKSLSDDAPATDSALFNMNKPLSEGENLFTYSEQFDHADWIKGGVTVIANDAVSPDGTLTAEKVIETATTGNHLLIQAITVISGNTYILSVYAKAAERSLLVTTSFGQFHSSFDLVNGTVNNSGGNICSIEDAGDGWYRCVTTIIKTNTTGNFYFGGTPDGSFNFTGDGVSGVHSWGAQVQNGGLTDYIKTEAIPASFHVTDSVIFNMITDISGEIDGYAINEAAINSKSQIIKVF